MRSAVLLLFVLSALPVQKYFEYQRPIVLPRNHVDQACAALDASLFATAAPGLADVRLYRDTIETPYAIHLAAPPQAKEELIRPLNLGSRGPLTTFDAVMPAGRYLDLNLVTNAEDFTATVTVSGSRTSSGHPTKLGAFTIFDFAKQKLGRSTVLHLPESDLPYLHFEIAGPVAPDTISGISVAPLPSSSPMYVTVAESGTGSVKSRGSIFEWELPAHVPVDQVVFAPPAMPANFSRDVTITVTPASQKPATDKDEPPHPATAMGSILRVHRLAEGRRIDEERLVINAPVVSFDVPSKWTIAIENGDDAPLIPKKIALQMVERDLCFEAVPDAHYIPAYHDAALTTPHYDYAALFSPESGSGKASLGPEQRNPSYLPRPDERAFTEKHPGLLWAALVAVILLLGAITLRSFRRATPIAGPH